MPPFILDVSIHPCRDQSKTALLKGAHGICLLPQPWMSGTHSTNGLWVDNSNLVKFHFVLMWKMITKSGDTVHTQRQVKCRIMGKFASWLGAFLQDAIMSSQALRMMTWSNGNTFRVTGPLCGEFIAHRWIPRTKDQWRGALVFSLICAWQTIE